MLSLSFWFFNSRRPSPDIQLIKLLPKPSKRADLTSSDTCRSCHPSEYASWHRTYHRTMTQPASPVSVLGDFDQVTLSDRGIEVRMEQEGDKFYVHYLRAFENTDNQRQRIVMTTGSHSLQNYWVEGSNGALELVPFAWWVRGARWAPVSDTFLQPSPHTHERVVWNGSCNYCHTTASVSKVNYELQSANTEALELGISCEACHGPAKSHTRFYSNPMNRYLSYLSDESKEADTLNRKVGIVNPLELDHRASTAVCGQCHGSFMTRNAQQVNMEGDPFRPGQTLEATRDYLQIGPDPFVNGQVVIRPLAHKSPKLTLRIESGTLKDASILGLSNSGPIVEWDGSTLEKQISVLFDENEFSAKMLATNNVAQIFPINWPSRQVDEIFSSMGLDQNRPAPRDFTAFWLDGTMRTAGREFNGIAISECYTEGELSCMSCHSMHHGSPSDMLASDIPGDGIASNHACIQCHTDIGQNMVDHTHHDAESEGSVCYNCHMPRTSYGLMGATRSHRIDSPNAMNTHQSGRPNACNLCHLDRSLGWASENLTQWFAQPPLQPSEASSRVSAAIIGMLSGDAAQRSIYAWHAGWQPAMDQGRVAEWAPYVLSVLMEDDYSVVRYIAAESIRKFSGFEELDFDYVASPELRQGIVQSVLKQINDGEPGTADEALLIDEDGWIDKGKVRDLLLQRDRRPIQIAE